MATARETAQYSGAHTALEDLSTILGSSQMSFTPTPGASDVSRIQGNLHFAYPLTDTYI